MAINSDIEQTASLLLFAIENSKMPLEEKQRRSKSILSCKEATNGLTMEQKVQKMSENDFEAAVTSNFDKLETLEQRDKLNAKIDALKTEMESQTKTMEDNQTKIISKVEELSKNMDEKLTTITINLDENNKTTAELKGKMSELDAGHVSNSGGGKVQKKFWERLLMTIEKCAWQIVAIVGIIVIGIICAPSVADLFKALIDKI